MDSAQKSGGFARGWGALLSTLMWIAFCVYGTIAIVILQRGAVIDQWIICLTMIYVVGGLWLLWVVGDLGWRFLGTSPQLNVEEMKHIHGGKLQAFTLLVITRAAVATYFGMRGYDAVSPAEGSVDHNILHNIYMLIALFGLIAVPKVIPAFVYHMYSSKDMRSADAGIAYSQQVDE